MIDSISGVFAEAGTYADRMHDGFAAESHIEDELSDWGWEFARISSDYYDNSLEVYFDDTVEDLEATEEQQLAIYAMGFSRFWLNFKGGKHKGGTERYYVDPKWLETVERRKQEAAKPLTL